MRKNCQHNHKNFRGKIMIYPSQGTVVHLNFRAGLTVPVSPGHWVNKADSIGLAGATRLTRSDFMFHIG